MRKRKQIINSDLEFTQRKSYLYTPATKEYGMNYKEMADRYGGSHAKYCQWHHKGILKHELAKLALNPSYKRPPTKQLRPIRANQVQTKYKPLFKEHRMVILEYNRGMCQVCGEEATSVHHIDKNKDNNLLYNLLLVCRRCHGLLHGTDKWRFQPKVRTKQSRPSKSREAKAIPKSAEWI